MQNFQKLLIVFGNITANQNNQLFDKCKACSSHHSFDTPPVQCHSVLKMSTQRSNTSGPMLDCSINDQCHVLAAY